MLNRLMKLISNNFGLKLLAGIFSLVLWLIVVNIDDPEITKPFSSSVVIENADYLTNQGKYYEVLNDSNNITFNVTGKRSYIERMGSTDFKVVANMENAAMNSETGRATVPIEISAIRYSGQLTIARTNKVMEIAVEELARAQFIIEPATTGALPEDCALGSITVSPNILKVSGPRSVVNTIDHVRAVINITGLRSDAQDSVIPILYDANGEEVPTRDLTMNLETVGVAVEILDIKNVSLIFNVNGTPAEGYGFIGMEYAPKSIALKGKSGDLNNITSINIPESALDITGAREDLVQTIDVTAYLPDGVALADKTKSKVEVTVHIAELETKVINLFTSNIQIVDLSEEYDLYFDDAVLQITVSGVKEDIDVLTAANIGATISAKDLEPGHHSIEVLLDINSDIICPEVHADAQIVAAGEIPPESEAEDEPQIDIPSDELVEDGSQETPEDDFLMN